MPSGNRSLTLHPKLALIAVSLFIASCQTAQDRIDSHTEAGMRLMATGRLAQAKEELSQALRIDPSHEPALLAMAEAELKARNAAAAIGRVNAALGQNPENIRALNLRSKVLLSIGRTAGAGDQTQLTLNIAPADAEANALRAAFFVQLNQPESAREWAEKALVIEPSNASAMQVLATLQLQSGDNEGALSLLAQGLSNHPGNQDLRNLRVDILRQLGRPQEVIAEFLTLLEQFPENLDYQRTLALQYLEVGAYEQSETTFRVIADQNPDSIDRQLDVVRMANTAYGEERAIEVLGELVQLRPNLFGLHYAYCEALLRIGATDQAASYLRKLAGGNFGRTDRASALALYGRVQLSRNDLRGTRETVRRVLELDSRHEEGLILQARLASQERRYDDAIEALRIVLVDTPLSVQANIELGRVYELRGQVGLATNHYADAAINSGQSSRVVNQYVDFLKRRDDLEQAERVLLRALSSNNQDHELLESLARVRVSKEDWTGARETALDLTRAGAPSTTTDALISIIQEGEGDASREDAAFLAASSALPAEALPLVGLIRSYMRAEEYDKAAQLLAGIIAREEEQKVQATVLMAQVRLAQGARTEAERLLYEAMDLEPESMFPIQSAFTLYMEIEDFETAARILERAKENDQNETQLRFLEANLAERSGDIAGAISVYRELARRYPNVAIVVNNLAALLLDLDDASRHQEALTMSQRLRSSPIAAFRDTYGWALVQNGDLSEGIRVLEAVVDTAPESAISLYHLGEAYRRNGNDDKSKNLLNKAAGLAKDSDIQLKSKIRNALGAVGG